MTALDTFLSLAGAAIAERATGPAAPVARRITALLAAPPQPAPPRQPARRPACAHLPAAIAEMRPDLATAFTALEPLLTWQSRAFPAAMPGFNDGHANARILGPANLEHGGLEQRAGLVAGFSLVAPGITYPDHDHPPEEIYLALSGGAWWNTETPWHEPGPGGIVHNPPGILHAMRGTSVPLLAIWFLLPSE